MAGTVRTTKRIRRRRWALALALPMVLIAAACEPVPHPNRVVVDEATTMRVVGLSGDGNYVVVTATAASDAVPGPGLWRIDRRDGSTTQLPAGATLWRISHDGQRLVLLEGGSSRVWRDGAYLTNLPLSAAVSQDIRFAVFAGILDPRLIRVDIATGVRTPMPSPGVPTSFNHISDDGSTVWYGTDQRQEECIIAFIDVATGTTTVHELCGATVNASGSHILVPTDFEVSVEWWGISVGGPTRLLLYAASTPGVVVAEMTASPETNFSEIHFAANLPVVWATEMSWSGSLSEPCGTEFTGPCDFTEEPEAVVVMTPERIRRTVPSPGIASAVNPGPPVRSTITPDGRFLVHSATDGSVYVHDRIGSRLESIAGDGDPQARPLISDDGRVIVLGEGYWSETGRGWYEHLADGEAPPAIP